MSSSNSGSDFTTNQRRRYLQEINRAIPTRQAALDNTTVMAALSTADSVARQPIAVGQIFEQVGDGTGASAALARDAACRSMPYPGPAMRDAAARTGCGWWFVADPATPSVGAYGTRRGPMHPTLDRDVAPGEWIWDPMEAQQREAQKQAAKIQTCPDIQFSSFPNMGWCTSTGRAIATDGAGNPLFPRTPGGDCPGGQIVTNAASCPPPTPPTPGAPPPPPGTAALCTPQADGSLSPACLQALIPFAGCSTGGALAQSLGSSSYAGTSSMFQSPHAALQRRGFSLHSGIVNDGQLTTQAALQSIGGLKQQAGIADGSRATSAAQNLCYGAAYNPCALNPDDTGPFDPTCIDQQLDAAGYAPNGGLRPAKIGMDYWNQSVLGTWQSILDNISWWKTTADTDAADPPSQANAINNVYGVSLQWPRRGCNYNGMSILRYAFQNADPSLFGVYPDGPQTHFLGRMLQSKGLTGPGIQQFASSNDMLPATGSSLEGNRHMAVFRPTTGGTYQFLINYDDMFQYTLLDSAGNTVVSSNGSLLRGGSGMTQTSQIVTLTPGQEYNLVYDTWNTSGPWTKFFQMSVNGGGWQSLPSDQLFLPVDRRQPLLELAFHKMPAGTVGPVSDTQGVIRNWFLNAPTGSVAGQPCLVVGGHGAYCGNWNKYSQGMRLRALKTICMKLYIRSGSVVRGGGGTNSTPSIFGMYNLPSTNTAGAPRLGAPQDSWNKPNRTAYFELTTWAGDALYPYGSAQQGGGDIIQQTFLNNIVGRPVPAVPMDTWFHYAYVWADDFTSYAVYVNGVLVANLPAATYDPALILEQIRIGCDSTDDGAAWQGGVAWFRGFDYRLSGDLIQRDMKDDWASLV